MIRYCKRICHSIFIRLALVLLLAAIGLNALTYHLFYGYQNGTDTTLNRNIVQYARYLVAELGTPPDRTVAHRLGETLRMRITSMDDSPGADAERNWSVGLAERFPSDKLHTWYTSDTLTASSLHGWHRIQVRAADGRILTFDLYPTAEERAQLRRFGLYFLAGTGLILLLAYAVIRFMLRPVRWLTEGAEAVRDGALHYRVPEGSSGELRDLTRTFNEMLARLNTMMGDQQKLLLAVSHELRTPLTRLKLRLEMLSPCPGPQGAEAEQGYDPDSHRCPAADDIAEDIREMEHMINALLDAARLRHEANALHREQTDLRTTAAEAAKRFADRKPGVLLTLPATPLIVPADRGRIATLLNNLLDNALKYSRPDSSAVELTATEKDTAIVITVRDYGVGIAQDDLPHLFDAFYRVDSSRTRDTGGFGLGLGLCQAIVQAHGGTIDIASTEGSGSTVTVTLPQNGKA